MSQITVSPSQTQFAAEDSETILSAAIRQGINLPHSCQSGVCGSCAATVVSGDVVQSAEYDDYVLTEEEIAAGTVLLCCTQARGDVVIEMPSYAGCKALTVRTLPARIADIETRGDMAVLTIALPKAPPFVFHSGQYMEILLKDGSRSYSIANAPHESGSLEFHIRLREGGLFSPQLFDGRLKKGSIIPSNPFCSIWRTPSPTAASIFTTARAPQLGCMTKPPCNNCWHNCPTRATRPSCPTQMKAGQVPPVALPNIF